MIYSPAGASESQSPLPLPTGRQALPALTKSMNLRSTSVPITKESIIEQIHCSENLLPAFAEAASRRQATPLLRQAQDGESRRTIYQRG